jgi:hypothetical protein
MISVIGGKLTAAADGAAMCGKNRNIAKVIEDAGYRFGEKRRPPVRPVGS